MKERSGPRQRANRRKQKALICLLRQVREEHGLPQAEVARKLGVQQSYVAKYESGERRLDLLELREVCEAVGVSIVEFVKRFEHELSVS